MPSKNANRVACPKCLELFPVEGDHPNAIVAVCYASGWTCDLRKWGSASTRIDVGQAKEKDRPTHALQLDPPMEAEASP